MRPSPRKESHSYHDGRIPADRAGDYKPGTRWRKYDKRIVDGNVDVSRIDRQDFNIGPGFDDGTVRIRSQIAIFPCLFTQPLNSIHDLGALRQNCVTQLFGPGAILGHHVQDRREWEQRQYARVPLQIVGADCICQCISPEVAVLVRPRRSLGNFVPECGCREYLCQQGIGIKRDSGDEVFELFRSERWARRRSRRSGRNRRRWWRRRQSVLRCRLKSKECDEREEK